MAAYGVCVLELEVGCHFFSHEYKVADAKLFLNCQDCLSLNCCEGTVIWNRYFDLLFSLSHCVRVPSVCAADW